MNESDLENELRALRPMKPSAQLEENIATALEPHAIALAEPRVLRTRTSGVFVERRWGSDLFVGWVRSLGWAGVGAAAAIAGVLALQDKPQPPAPAAPVVTAVAEEAEGDYVPAESESELVAADQSDILYVDGEEPLRQVHFLSVERYAWTNPNTGARVEVEVPREDIVFMPVAMQ